MEKTAEAVTVDSFVEMEKMAEPVTGESLVEMEEMAEAVTVESFVASTEGGKKIPGPVAALVESICAPSMCALGHVVEGRVCVDAPNVICQYDQPVALDLFSFCVRIISSYLSCSFFSLDRSSQAFA